MKAKADSRSKPATPHRAVHAAKIRFLPGHFMPNRWPAEWEAQSAIMLTWPRPDGDFAANFAEARACFVDIARAICIRQKLIISFATNAQAQQERDTLMALPGAAQNLSIYVLPNNDVWARDHGPIGVYAQDKATLLNFNFDAWGGKYAANLDQYISRELHQLQAFAIAEMQDVDLVLEGGAIEGNGRGTLLATERSVLDPKRNAKSRTEIEALLQAQLGIQHFLWLKHGALAGDDTDSHIDTLARFVAADHIVYQASAGADDPNYSALSTLKTELESLRDEQGQPYRLSALPSPGVHRNAAGDLLPAGYANFLICNTCVLMPTYDVDADKAAIDCLQSLFPQREVIGIDCRALIEQYGSLHCVTMNIPQARL